MSDAPPPPPQPPYGQPPYGQNPYGQYPQGQYPPYYHYAPPDHPQATTALVVGLVSVLGLFVCGVTILASPWAWIAGHKARKEIAASQGRYGGEGKATAGMVLGIIGTILMVLAIVAVVAFFVWVFSTPGDFVDGDLEGGNV